MFMKLACQLTDLSFRWTSLFVLNRETIWEMMTSMTNSRISERLMRLAPRNSPIWPPMSAKRKFEKFALKTVVWLKRLHISKILIQFQSEWTDLKGLKNIFYFLYSYLQKHQAHRMLAEWSFQYWEFWTLHSSWCCCFYITKEYFALTLLDHYHGYRFYLLHVCCISTW